MWMIVILFDIVMGKFDAYFIPKRNVIHERARFHQRIQGVGEKAEAYIRALYELSEHCEFGANREEIIRDRIVVGIRDKELSLKLQLKPGKPHIGNYSSGSQTRGGGKSPS